MSKFEKRGKASDYKLKIPSFHCDSPLENVKEPFPSQASFFSVHLAPPKGGKSSLMVACLADKNIYKKKFNHVLLVAPDRSMASLKKNIFADLPENQVYNYLDGDTLRDIKDQLEGYASNDTPENSLLILDDIGAFLKDSDIQKTLQELVFNRRHLRVSIMLLVQHFMSIPRPIRTMISNMFIFKQSNKKSLETIAQEVMFFSPQESEDLCNTCFCKPHDFLALNIADNRVFHNLDELFLKNNNMDMYTDGSQA